MEINTALLKEHNLKITTSRLIVLEYLQSAHAPVDSSEIVEYLQTKHVHIDRATIFRALATFKDAGIIKAIQLNESKYRYELASRPEHHHILCSVCGNIEDIDICIDEAMERKIVATTGYTIATHTLEFIGVCPACKRLQSNA